jgi:hypothetical protein
MGLVTLTDIDTIEGCLRFLESHPEAADFIISEEVTTRDPNSGRTYRVLIYGLDEGHHREAGRFRDDIRDLSDYLQSAGLVAALAAGPGDAGAGIWTDPDRESVLALFDRIEVRSGAHGRRHNELATRLMQARRRHATPAAVGGSCAHGPSRVGRTFTEARADGPDGFFAELRAGRTWVAGEDGGLRMLSRDFSGTVALGCLGQPGRLLGLPLDLLCIPLRHGWGYARQAARVRRTQRSLDLEDLTVFQQKAKKYLLPAQAVVENAGAPFETSPAAVITTTFDASMEDYA